MPDPVINLLSDLVAIDSVNPSLVPGGAGEAEIAQLIAHSMRASGLDVEVTEVAPGRPNVVGLIESANPGPALMLCGHTDTVGVAGMAAPFDPVQRDGRLYGRGSQDMKGGVAAMISAAARIASSGGLKSGRLVVAAVVDEEYASLGAEALLGRWHADGAVITEPNDLLIGVGHKGFTWIEITTRGRAAHGSRPAEGRDAILRMGRVLNRLEALNGELQSRPAHPILATGSLHASFMAGGREMSTYPDLCTLVMERRTIIGETPESVVYEVESILADLHAQDSEFEAAARLLFTRPPYETPDSSELPSLLDAALRSAGRTPRRGGMTFWTDGAILGHAGIPSVVFGPGGEGLHSIEEYVLIDEVIACRDALVELTRSFCSTKG